MISTAKKESEIQCENFETSMVCMRKSILPLRHSGKYQNSITKNAPDASPYVEMY